MTSNLGLCQKNHIFCIHIKQNKNLRMRCCFFSNWKKEINWKWNKSCQIQVFLFMINCYNVEHLILYQKVKNYAYWMAQGVVVSSDRLVYIKMWMIQLAMYKTIKWSHGVMRSIATAVFFFRITPPATPPTTRPLQHNTTSRIPSTPPPPSRIKVKSPSTAVPITSSKSYTNLHTNLHIKVVDVDGINKYDPLLHLLLTNSAQHSGFCFLSDCN